jgi:flagellar protein FlbD
VTVAARLRFPEPPGRASLQVPAPVPISQLYRPMIRLTRINRIPLVINSDLIEHVEVTPDTVVSLTTGQKFMVLESADEVIDRVIRFRRQILHGELNRKPVF